MLNQQLYICLLYTGCQKINQWALASLSVLNACNQLKTIRDQFSLNTVASAAATFFFHYIVISIYTICLYL